MPSVAAMIFVIMIVVLGIGSCWAITAQGAANGPQVDTFNNSVNATYLSHVTTISTPFGISSMVVTYIPFFLAVLVLISMVFAWLWKAGHGTQSQSKY